MLESDAGTAFRATVNIVVSEAKIAVRHPAILGAAVVSAGLMMVDLLSGAAVMQTLSVSAGAWLLTLAAAAFLVGSWHSSSETRYSTEEHLDSLPYGRVVRTVGLLGGCLGPAAIGVALISIYLMASQAMNPAGEVMPAELVTSILAIVVAWFAGVLVRGGKRVRRAPALILIVYATLQLLGSPDVEIGASSGASGSRARGLLLWMPSSAFDTPFDALIRPSMPRAFYLLALASLFLAILMVEARGSIEFRGVTAIAIAGMLVFAAATSVMSFTPSQEWAYPAVSGPSVDWTKLIESQECTESQPSLCALPGFTPWIASWQAVLSRVRSILPYEAGPVIQRPQNVNFASDPLPREVTVIFLEWDRPGAGRPIHAFAFASRLGHSYVNLPGSLRHLCDAKDQGRTVLPLWLAAAATQNGESILRAAEEAGIQIPLFAGIPLGGVQLDARVVALARMLAGRDPAEVSNVLGENWSDLLSPTTDVAAVAAWFGIEPNQLPRAVENQTPPRPIPNCA